MASRLKPVLKVLFILSWVILLLWSFHGTRVWVRQNVVWALGFGVPPGGESFQEHIPLGAFYPRSELQPRTQNIPEKPANTTIEFHGHIFKKYPKDFLGAMDKTGTGYFINLAGRTVTLDAYQKLRKKFHNTPRILHFVGFNWSHTPKHKDFGERMARDLEAIAGAKNGTKGIKLWKNLGLMARDPEGKLIPIDDKRLDPVWDVCAKYNLVVGIHTADPPSFFRPIDAHNERFGELGRRPEWSFARKGLPSFDELLAQRDRLFERRRDIRFVALHFGEYSHDLNKAESFLEKHPNVWVDIAQRIDELGRQPAAARAFLLKWQDRILFGTDGYPDFKKVQIYWRFLETGDEYFDYYPSHKPRKGLWKIYGLNLPGPVLKKIYYDNAAGLLKLPALK